MPAYRRHGHRVSLLPLVQFCGPAGRLSEEHGAGRPAAMSSAYHAQQAGASNAGALLARLTDREREEVGTWRRPTDVPYDGTVLTYESADKEVTLGLDDWGFYVDPETGEDCLTIGHMDFGWHVGPHAIVGDIKKEIWTTSDGPDSLQLHTYAWAYAQKHGCESYTTGLWIASDGEWLWNTELVVLDSPRGRDIWERIYQSATNMSDEYAFGAHCRSCYARLHCPEYVMPAVTIDSWFGPFAGGAAPETSSEAGDLVLKIQAAEDTLEAVRKNVQAMVSRGALRATANGKKYAAVECKGRESVDKERLFAELGDGANKFVRRGAPYDQFRWLKA